MSNLRLRLSLVALFLVAMASAYTPVNSSNNGRFSTGASRKNQWTMPPSSPTSQTAPMIAQKMLKTVGTEQERGAGWRLSNSVLASCDTLPSFPTAHGILSPETVSRMDEMTSNGPKNEAVATFLKTYR